MIIDMHTHLHNYEFLGPGRRFTEEQFIKKLDFHGIGMAAVSNVFCLETDFIYGNKLVFDFMEKYPERIMAFPVLHPLFPDDSAKVLEEGKGRGIRGIKLHCLLSGIPYSDRRHMDIIDSLRHLKLPVTLHTGASLIKDVETVVREFPDVMFMLGHVGGTEYREMLRVIKDRDNVVADINGDVFLEGYLEEIVDSMGDERVVYGSDFVFMDPAIMISIVRKARIPDSSKEKILFKNAERILGL